MTYRTYASFLVGAFCALTSVTACNGETLDGGSNTSSSGTTSSSSGGTGTTPAPESPLTGQIAGNPFTPSSTELELVKTSNGNEWMLQFHNYKIDCGTVGKEEGTGADKLIVTVGGLTPAAGTSTIEYGDAHAATFQVGVYEASGPEPKADPAKAGTLRIDTWSEEGATVTGYLELSNEESSVKGTFTAKICKGR